MIAKTAIENLVTINDQAGKPAKTVMIVNEDSLFGSGLAKLLNAQLPERGFQVLETIAHPTPTRDFNNVVLKIKAQNPDLVIPANYYNEYVLLARTMQQQKVRPKGDLLRAGRRGLVLQIRQGISGSRAVHHGLQSLVRSAQPEGAGAEEEGRGIRASSSPTKSIMNYSCVLLLADALERAASRRPRQDHRGARHLDLRRSLMPYGPTKFVNGQNQGAAPVNTQVLDNDIQVIFPATSPREAGLPAMPATNEAAPLYLPLAGRVDASAG